MTRLSAILCALVTLAVGGCGGSSSSSGSSSGSASASTPTSSSSSTPASASATSGGAGGGALALAAAPSGQLKFDKTSLSSSAGTVRISFSNAAPEGHNLTVASSSGAVVGATPTFQGGSKTLTLKLKPGTYTFYCSVPGHRQGGMQGTLVVK